MRTAAGMRRAIVVAVLASLVWACAGPSARTTSSPFGSDPPSAIVEPTAAMASDPRFAAVDAAQARWVARQPHGYAYIFTHNGPSGHTWNWRYRVTAFDGQVQAQSLDGWTGSDEDLALVTVDGLFDTVRWGTLVSGDTTVTYDPDLGYPAEIVHVPPMVADGDFSETMTDFVTTADDQAALTREAVRSARAAWARWQPTAYEYTWRRFAAAGPGAGTAWLVRYTDGRASTDPGPGSDGAVPDFKAAVGANFDSVEAALDAGAWVDLTVDQVTGLPLLAAIDPTPAVSGDEYWIRITFQDIEHEEATAAVQAARERWAAAAAERYSYTWRYRGRFKPLTYGVTMNGDVATLRRAPGTDIPEAASDAGPRIADTFTMIEQVLLQGGHVAATYDPKLGYPVRVAIDPAGDAGPPGTITITDFVIP